MADFHLPADSFGDPFSLADLPLPRSPAGYAVQLLDTDQLLDRNTGRFLPVRSNALNPLYLSFEDAFDAAEAWVIAHRPDDHRLAIVPVGYDEVLERHILIYGVLCAAP